MLDFLLPSERFPELLRVVRRPVAPWVVFLHAHHDPRVFRHPFEYPERHRHDLRIRLVELPHEERDRDMEVVRRRLVGFLFPEDLRSGFLAEKDPREPFHLPAVEFRDLRVELGQAVAQRGLRVVDELPIRTYREFSGAERAVAVPKFVD